MQADLHVHSRHSRRPSQWLLQKIGCPESFTEPLHLYQVARRRGMGLVTITDHNRIEGALEIAHLPNVVIGEEVTSYFPEDGCKVHVLVYRITEAQHAEIQKLRANLYELVAYLRGERILHAAAHPFYAVNDRLSPDHIEKLLLLFRVFEINGDTHPEANRRLRRVLAALRAETIQRLADRHGLEPLGSQPWVKRLIGGSDDHSSLSIGHTCTRVSGARSVEEFFAGLEDGRAEVIEQPSSPKHLAHNLYSIAYQFYRHKLDLGSRVPHDFLLRFVDRSLRGTATEASGLLSRLHLLWQYPRLRKIRGSLPAPLLELLRKESARLIREEPALFAMPRGSAADSPAAAERWFRFIHKMSNRILLGFANHLLDHLSGANLFSIFHTIGSAGGFCTLLAPYFVGFAHHHAQIRMARRLTAALGETSPAGGERPVCAVFAESAEQARRVNAEGESGEVHLLTCEGAVESGAGRRFEPIGVYDFMELPGERLVYPPLLEMLDFCFSRSVSRIHLAGSGPTGLAGLFIGRFLELPMDATHNDAVPRLARRLTQDTFIEDLAWKYLVWFYGQVRTVAVFSRATARLLVDKGVDPAKIRLVAAPDTEPEDGHFGPLRTPIAQGAV
ncbi:MAG: glycosyltransferase [Desulfobacterales bacterium]